MKMNSTYFDLPKNLSTYEKSSVVILPVPFEATTSYIKGTAKAPLAILTASLQVELYDEELGFEPASVGIFTMPSLKVKGKKINEIMQEIESAFKRTISDGKLPIMIGGEHSITPSAVRASSKFYKRNLTVVQLDAHADLREKYDGTKWSHACAMARVLEICPTVHIGIRNISKEEAILIKREKIPILFAHEIIGHKNWIADALSAIKTNNVYITFDVDVFDCSILPDTGTPEPGGLTWYDALSLIKAISKEKNIIAFDFVELCPRKGHHASDFTVAKLIYKCIGYWAKGRKNSY